MSKMPKPYLKCEKRGDTMILTLLGSAPNGHTLQGRGFVPVGDDAALGLKVEELITAARSGQRILEKQANGNS